MIKISINQGEEYNYYYLTKMGRVVKDEDKAVISVIKIMP